MGPGLDASRDVDARSQRRRLLRIWHPSDVPGGALAPRGPDEAADARGQQRDGWQDQQFRPDPGTPRRTSSTRAVRRASLPRFSSTVPSYGSRIRRQSGSFRCSAAIRSASPRGSTTRGRPSGSPVRAATARCFRCRSGRTPCSGTRTGSPRPRQLGAATVNIGLAINNRGEVVVHRRWPRTAHASTGPTRSCGPVFGVRHGVSHGSDTRLTRV